MRTKVLPAIEVKDRRPNPPRWGIIADDLTGACDTGAVFAQQGFSTTVLMRGWWNSQLSAEVTVLTTDSRNDSSRQARRKVRQAIRQLQDRRIRVLYKKIDSTLKGHVIAETESAMTAGGLVKAIICPAYPAQGRMVRAGILRVRGQRLADLSAWFASQGVSDFLPIHAPFSVAKVARALGLSHRVIVTDAQTTQHLVCLAQAALNSATRPLLVGSAGLAGAVAEVLFEKWSPKVALKSNAGSVSLSQSNPRGQNRLQLERKHRVGPASGTLFGATSDSTGQGHVRFRRSRIASSPVLIFTGSNNPVTQRQIRALRRSKNARAFSLLRHSHREIAASLAQSHFVVLRVPIHRLPEKHISRLLAPFDFLFLQTAIPPMVLIGGDTASLMLRQLRVRAIELCGEIVPGIPWGHLIGGRAEGMTVCTKAGGFGDDNSVVRIVNFLAHRPVGAS